MRPIKKFTTPTAVLGCSHFVGIADNSPRVVEWQQVHQWITSDRRILENTSKARKLLADGNEAGYARQKSLGGAITPAVQCSDGRKAENILCLTGVSMVDLDGVPDERMEEVEAAIKADEHTFLYHRTASGHGCRIFFTYTADTPEVAYLDAWRWGNQYYSLVTGHDHDPATKDPNRLSFLSHDADAFFNPDASPFRIVEIEKAPLPRKGFTDDDRIAWAENLLARQGIVYSEGGRHHYLLQLLILLVKYGVDSDTAYNHIVDACPRGEKEARGLVEWVYSHCSDAFGSWLNNDSYKSGAKSTAKGGQVSTAEGTEEEPTPKGRTGCATVNEIRDFLESSGRLRYNVISGNIEIFSNEEGRFVDIDDRVSNTLWHDCIISLGKYVRTVDFDRELNSEAIPLFNPFNTYFSNLPAWDGTDHIGNLAGHIHCKSTATIQTTDSDGDTIKVPLIQFCFRKWFVAMVASWLDPKVLNHTILTFIGVQGIYKSTFFRQLLPPELGRYFLAKGNSTYVSKDDKIAVSSYGLIDFEEIDSMKDADLNAVKALVTTEVIAERAAYARNRENRPHLASFCATGNNMKFLTDLTGNRRWLPFHVLSIDSPYFNPIDYPQLYAQAQHLAQSGFQYWFTREEDLLLEPHKSTFAEPCAEEELFLKYFRQPSNLEVGQLYSATEILARCSVDYRQPLSARRLGNILIRMGIVQKRTKAKRGYILVERTYDEIQQDRVNQATQALKEEKAAAQGQQTTLPTDPPA